MPNVITGLALRDQVIWDTMLKVTNYKYRIEFNKDYKVPVKMAVYANATLKSSQNHNKITTKLQNNHYRDPPKIQLNRSPTNKDIMKTH